MNSNLHSMLVYELYFMYHMKEVGIDVSPYIQLTSFKAKTSAQEKEDIIKHFYEWYQKPENPVRQRMLLVDTRSKDIIGLINKSV